MIYIALQQSLSDKSMVIIILLFSHWHYKRVDEMNDFLKELNSISRSKEEVEEALRKEHEKEIYNNMILDDALLDEFDENFLKKMKDVIRKRAYMGDYIILDNKKKQINGRFSLVKKHIGEYIGIRQFNGIKFENEKYSMSVPFDANLIVYEPAEIKKRFLFTKRGFTIYANSIIKEHIINLLACENIFVYRIDNMPENIPFVSIKSFQKNYMNRTIIFYYRIEF